MFILVSITPGAMAFTLILLNASSLAKAFVKEFIAPFDAEYKTSQAAPSPPQTDDILIMLPSFLKIYRHNFIKIFFSVIHK